MIFQRQGKKIVALFFFFFFLPSPSLLSLSFFFSLTAPTTPNQKKASAKFTSASERARQLPTLTKPNLKIEKK